MRDLLCPALGRTPREREGQRRGMRAEDKPRVKDKVAAPPA